MSTKKKTKAKKKRKSAKKTLPSPAKLLFRWAKRAFWGALSFQAVLIFLFAFVNPPSNYYIWTESQRLGSVKQDWKPIEDISVHMARSVVAAEDANYCLHWGFDLEAIKTVVAGGNGKLRGASTLSQQVAKNVFLWPGRSWIRKAIEAETTILLELFWTKRRILEVYLNVAEFDEGVFGTAAAAQHYFGVTSDRLSLLQSARLAAILPNPKGRSAKRPSAKIQKRARSIMSGAETIAADGRDFCFQS